jgi:Rps23 Pro-64 3,4-dihydroxylase Tpa1-like proline 4-hydroxylase
MKLPLLNKIDFETFKAKCQGAPSFPHFYLDNFLEESFANEVHESFPSYSDAKQLGKTFSAVNEKKKIQITDSKKFPPAVYKLHELLASNEFVEMVSDLMGIKNLIADPTMLGGGIHETNAGGHLDVHVDFNYNEELKLHRRVNILIYFNKDWHDDYGGYLDLWDKHVKNCLGSYAPIFNRAAGFTTNEISWHGVTPLTCPPDRMRKSFAVYYYTKEAPPGWDGVVHSTIFKARPTEYFKGGIAMPAEKLVRTARGIIDAAKANFKKLLR